MSNRPTVNVPELNHDAIRAREFGSKVSANGRTERRIVAALVAHLARYDFVPVSVFDGAETTKVSDAKSAMELIFDLDEASLRFRRPGFTAAHGVLLVLGNGEYIISDWNYSYGDRDGFDKAMDAFNVEDYL